MITKFILFNENLQQAEKLYFKTNLIPEDDKIMILSITHGDNFTKAICELYIQLKKSFIHRMDKRLLELYNQIKTYNKDIFPIKDFSLNHVNYHELEIRKKLLFHLISLPSIAVRNMKEIRTPRNFKEMYDYEHLMEYFTTYFSLFKNRNIKIQNQIYKKMFKSGVTLNYLIDFIEEKSNLLGGNPLNKQIILKIIKKNTDDLEIVYEKEDLMVIKVSDLQGIKDIGCNSLWCFTYGSNNYSDWSKYSYNGIVYVIIDFKQDSDTPQFMHVLISPLEKKYKESDYNSPLYDMSNQQEEDPHWVLKYLFGKFNYKKLFDFNY
jgi:hypothetical protein